MKVFVARADRLFLLSTAFSFGLLFVGFRVFYESVLPEVAGLVLAGLVLGFLWPRLSWASAFGLCVGIVLSERYFPATPPAAHVAQYGAPGPAAFGDFLLLWAIPLLATAFGAIGRVVAKPDLRV